MQVRVIQTQAKECQQPPEAGRSKEWILPDLLDRVGSANPNFSPVIITLDFWPPEMLLLFSRVWLFATPRTAALQASLSFITSWSLLRLMSFESVMPSSHLILCRLLLLLPPIPPSITVFSSESALRMRWPRYLIIYYWPNTVLSFPSSSDGKASVCNAGDLGSIPWLGRSPGRGNSSPLQYSCLENPMDHGAW